MAERFQIEGKFFVLAKIQSAVGTAATPAAGDVILADDLQIVVESDDIVREYDRPFRGAFPKLKVNARFKITGTMELVPHGTAGTVPAIDPILICTSHASTITASDVTYAPISIGDKVATLYFYTPDPNTPANMMRFVCVDASGTLGTVTQKIGEFSKAPFEITGTYADPTSVAAVVPDYSNYFDPQPITKETWEVIFDTGPLGALPSVGKYRPNTRELEFGQAQQNSYVEGSELKGVVPGDRTETTLSLTIFDPGSAKNMWAIAATNATNYALRSVLAPVTSPAGKTLTLEYPTVAPDFPEFNAVVGMQGLKFNLTPLPTSAGNNDYSIIFS